jgi:riboflavin transporter
MNNVSKRTNILVKVSLLSAIAAVLMYIEFPILPAFEWLKIDLSDIPALIGAFAFGPVSGIIIEAFKILLKLLLKGTQSGGIGELANFIIGIAFVVPAAIIYKQNKTKKTAVVGIAAGTIAMSVVGLLANYYMLIPLYKNFLPALKESSYVMKYMIYGVLPFNLIKGVMVSVVTLLIYKKIAVILHAEDMASSSGVPKKTA